MRRPNAVRLACADDTFRLLEHEHILELIALLGLDGVDLCLMTDRSPVQPEQVRGDIPGWARRLDERVRSRDLAVADLFVIPWTNFERLAPNHPDIREREEAAALFRDMLEFAAGVGAPGMTMLPGIDWPGEGHEESFQRSSRELAWRAEEARAAGVRFSIEPHLGSVAQSPADARRLCEETPGLELTLDYSHFVYQGYPQAEIEPLIPHARHFHARGAREKRMQVALKENVIDFERVIDVMGETGYDGYLGLEYVWLEWEHCNECDNVSETVLLRDRLRAKLAGKPWTYPDSRV